MELYLDAAATTKIADEVLEEYVEILKSTYASTGSLHKNGQNNLLKEIESKEKIASLLKVKPQEILFNSGATEGNNYAIKGVAFQYKNRGKTIITTKVEHPSVYQSVKQLETDYGFNCIYLDVDSNGVIDMNQFKQVMNDDVILVSIMYVNHEVGSIMPIKQVSEILKKYPKAIFHSDITQAIGKTPIDLSLVDIATMSAHKIHGLKGSGFIYKKEKVTLYPIITGHPSDNALRAGTSNFPANIVMSKALELTLKKMRDCYDGLRANQNKIIDGLKEIPEIVINTNQECCIPGIVNFSVVGYNSEVFIRALSDRQIYVSSRTVCSKVTKEKISSTLVAMGKDISICISSIRASFDSVLTDEMIEYFISNVKDVMNIIRK